MTVTETSRQAQPAREAHAWLPAVLPEETTEARVFGDEDLAGALEAAGASLVDAGGDVEIVGSAAAVSGDADVAVVSLGRIDADVRSLPARAGRRVVAAAAVRWSATRARSALRRHGYVVEVLYWDLAHRLRLPCTDAPPDFRLAERLPRQALVVGRRGAGRTLLARVVADARAATGLPLPMEAAFLAGVMVIPAGEAVLRVGVGPGAQRFEDAHRALTTLATASPPDSVAARIPAPFARGRTGLAEWAVERRLRGTPCPGTLSPVLLEDCASFLADLHLAVEGGEAPTAAEDAEVLVPLVDAGGARALRELARRVDDTLGAVPRGFGHGDFWSGNLLVDGERLAGVVDWETAGRGRLPLLDLLQLRVNSEHPHSDDEWGPTIVERLLPWARAGGDEVALRYCRAVGFEPDARELEALVVAYWLDRAAHQFASYAERHDQPRFIERNVRHVLRALTDGETRGPRLAGAVRWEAFTAIDDEWEDLAARSGGSPWVRPGWMHAWDEAFGRGDLRLLSLRRDGRLAALVPVEARGRALHAPANWHTPTFELLAEDDDARRELAEALVGEPARRIELRFLEEERESLAAFTRAARSARRRVLAHTLELSPYVDLTPGWDAYEAGLSKRLRTDLRRRRRRLEEQGEVTFEVLDGRERLDQLLAEGFRVEGSGWKAAQGTAITSRPETERFYTVVARWAAANDWLRLAFLRLDGKPLAFHFDIVCGGRLHYLKGGYDPEFVRFAPGKLLQRDVMEWAFAEALASYEFLGDREPWKLEWASTWRRRVAVQAFISGAVGTADWAANAYARPIARRAVARVRKSRAV